MHIRSFLEWTEGLGPTFIHSLACVQVPVYLLFKEWRLAILILRVCTYESIVFIIATWGQACLSCLLCVYVNVCTGLLSQLLGILGGEMTPKCLGNRIISSLVLCSA